MICDPRCGLSFRMFQVHLRRKCILHLDGISWRYQWDPSHLMYHLRLVFPYSFSVLMICPLVWVGYWSLQLLLHYCQFLLLCLLVFVLHIEVLLCWVHRYYNCYVFLLDWPLDHYVVSFLISCNLLYFKVHFVWCEDCYSSFLLLPICTEYVFLFSHFQSICVLRSKVGIL